METGYPRPRFLALCGHPLSGKTTAAEILRDFFGYTIVDDGLPLRQIAVQHLGLTERQVFTQEGKLEYVTINSERWQVRKVLGEIGNAFEEKFGPDVIPEMAYRSLPATGHFVFCSVRREQGLYHRNRGAVVCEIRNPNAGPSEFEFDRFNPDHCHDAIINDGIWRGLGKGEAIMDLKAKLETFLRWVGRQAA